MRKSVPEPEDWPLIGFNVRFMRSVQSMSQIDLAQAARVSPTTVVSLERGRPVRKRTLERICAALSVAVGEIKVRRTLNVKTGDLPYVVHHPSNAEWTAYADFRRHVPEDSQERIQSPAERRRLGRLGLVPVFGTGPSFVMPRGPGVLIDEIYQPFDFPTDVYRNCVLYCLRGTVRLTIGGTAPFVVEEGGMVGYDDDVTIRAEPTSALGPDDEPPLVLWIGANRKGRFPV